MPKRKVSRKRTRSRSRRRKSYRRRPSTVSKWKRQRRYSQGYEPDWLLTKRDNWSKVAKSLGGETTMDAFGPTWQDATDTQRQNRVLSGFYGQGDYKTIARNVGKYGLRVGGALAGAAGGFKAGGWAGAVEGGQLGWEAGRSLSKMWGLGDYYGNTGQCTNQIIGTGVGSQTNISVNAGDLSGDVFITRTEFVGNITATVQSTGRSNFEIRRYELNPGVSETFPFLSQIAQNYELYDFEGLMFQYKPTSGETSAATTTGLGKVIMGTNYDPTAADFPNSVIMENYDYTNSFKPSVGGLHGVETAHGRQHMDLMYVRPSGEKNKDMLNTDLGAFFVATEGIPGPTGSVSESLIGELWVSYRCRLSRAQLFTSPLVGGLYSNASFRWANTSTNIMGPEFDYVGMEQNDLGGVVIKAYSPANPAARHRLAIITFPPNDVVRSYAISFYIHTALAETDTYPAEVRVTAAGNSLGVLYGTPESTAWTTSAPVVAIGAFDHAWNLSHYTPDGLGSLSDGLGCFFCIQIPSSNTEVDVAIALNQALSNVVTEGRVTIHSMNNDAAFQDLKTIPKTDYV